MAAKQGLLDENTRMAEARWPAELCRDILPDKARVAVMQDLVHDISDQAAILSGRQENLRLSLRRPHRNLHSGTLTIRTIIEHNLVDPILQNIFDNEVARLWPQGWTTLIGPERARGLLAAGPASRIRVTGNPDISMHQKICLTRRFGKIH